MNANVLLEKVVRYPVLQRHPTQHTIRLKQHFYHSIIHYLAPPPPPSAKRGPPLTISVCLLSRRRKRSRNESDGENRWDRIRAKVKLLLLKIRRDTHYLQVKGEREMEGGGERRRGEGCPGILLLCMLSSGLLRLDFHYCYARTKACFLFECCGGRLCRVNTAYAHSCVACCCREAKLLVGAHHIGWWSRSTRSNSERTRLLLYRSRKRWVGFG